MIPKTITYTDYNGVERTETFYFNLSKAELMEMNLTTTGGMDQLLRRIIAEKDTVKIAQIFKEIILKSYGEKSPDGRRFIKNDEIREAFEQTEAYSILYMELISDPDMASKFIIGLLPSDIAKQVEEQQNSDTLTITA